MKYLSVLLIFGKLVDASFGGESLFESTDGVRCRTECIDAGDSWCSNLDYSRGICCTGGDWFCRIGRYCSSDIKTEASKAEGMKYWLCPADQDVCGKKDLAVQFKSIKSDQKITMTIPKGNLCTYEFIPNIDAGAQDMMKIDFTDVKEVDSTSTAVSTTDPTKNKISAEPNPQKIQMAYALGNEYLTAEGAMTADVLGKSIQTVYPGKIYVSVLAPENKDAQVTIQYSITDVDPTIGWSSGSLNTPDAQKPVQTPNVATTYDYQNENVLWQPNGANITLYVILILSFIGAGLLIYYYMKTYDPKGDKVKQDLRKRLKLDKKDNQEDRHASNRPNLADSAHVENEEDKSAVIELQVQQDEESQGLKKDDALKNRGHELATRPPVPAPQPEKPASNVKVASKLNDKSRTTPRKSPGRRN